MEKFFEYANGRFVNPAKINTANVYSKAVKDEQGRDTGNKEMRVAIDLDVKEASKSVIYSDPFPTKEKAIEFIQSIPVRES